MRCFVLSGPSRHRGATNWALVRGVHYFTGLTTRRALSHARLILRGVRWMPTGPSVLEVGMKIVALRWWTWQISENG